MDLKRFALGFLGYGTGAVLETVMIIIFLVVSFTLFDSWELLVSLIGLLGMMAVAFRVLMNGTAGLNIRYTVVKMSVINFFLVVLIFGVINLLMWHEPQDYHVMLTGFVKMQPLSPSIAYRNTTFRSSFTNALGTTVKLTSVTVRESISGLACPANGLTVSPDGTSVNNLSGSTYPSIKTGGTFTLKCVCPPKSDGESYDLIITIKYRATMGGITTNHTDTGHIKGEADPP